MAILVHKDSDPGDEHQPAQRVYDWRPALRYDNGTTPVTAEPLELGTLCWLVLNQKRLRFEEQCLDMNRMLFARYLIWEGVYSDDPSGQGTTYGYDDLFGDTGAADVAHPD